MLAETSGTDAAVIASFQKSAVLPAILVWMLLSVVFLQQKIGSPLVKMVASLALSLVMLLWRQTSPFRSRNAISSIFIWNLWKIPIWIQNREGHCSVMLCLS